MALPKTNIFNHFIRLKRIMPDLVHKVIWKSFLERCSGVLRSSFIASSLDSSCEFEICFDSLLIFQRTGRGLGQLGFLVRRT